MAEIKLTGYNPEISIPDYETKDVVDEKLKDLDTKLQKKIKTTTKDIEKEVNKVGNNVKKVQDNFNKQIEQNNQRLEAYIKNESDKRFVKSAYKSFFDKDIDDVSENFLRIQFDICKDILKRLIKEFKFKLKNSEKSPYVFDEMKYLSSYVNPEYHLRVKFLVDTLQRIKDYENKYGE